jgi:hypothetical protein
MHFRARHFQNSTVKRSAVCGRPFSLVRHRARRAAVRSKRCGESLKSSAERERHQERIAWLRSRSGQVGFTHLFRDLPTPRTAGARVSKLIDSKRASIRAKSVDEPVTALNSEV